MEAQDCHEYSLKELPTKEQKLRRNKDRRNSLTLPPIRLRLKSCASPLHDMEMDRSLSDRSVSSSPEAINLHLSPSSAFSCYNKYSATSRLAPSVSPPTLIMDATNSSNHCFEENSPVHDYIEQPLDMSTKRSNSSFNNEAQSYEAQQQQRPSVITCASALLRTHCNLTDVNHHVCKPSVADDDNDSHANPNSDSESNNSDCSNHEISRPGHRREIVSGSCDPVIDEHFRRSLGKDYQQIFSKSSGNSVAITVDDHFAKALGDKWLQLQQTTKAVGQDDAQQSSTNGLSSKQFLQHSHQIVST